MFKRIVHYTFILHADPNVRAIRKTVDIFFARARTYSNIFNERELTSCFYRYRYNRITVRARTSIRLMMYLFVGLWGPYGKHRA